MALLKRSTVNRALQRHRQKRIAKNNGGVALPNNPVDHNFDIPEAFKEMVLFDSGCGETRVIIVGNDILCRSHLSHS